jgi:hypothetical protein
MEIRIFSQFPTTSNTPTQKTETQEQPVKTDVKQTVYDLDPVVTIKERNSGAVQQTNSDTCGGTYGGTCGGTCNCTNTCTCQGTYGC